MQATTVVSPARHADIGVIRRILVHSIKVGCCLDHRNDPLRVDTWLRSKSLEHIRAWLDDPRRFLRLAHHLGKPVGVGMASRDGRILLCHVQPEWFRRGVGRALLADLEHWLGQCGCNAARLGCTQTALPFCLHLGYRRAGPAYSVAGLEAIPLCKPIEQSAGRG